MNIVRIGLVGIASVAMLLIQAHANATTITATWEGTAYNASGSSSSLGTPQNGDAVEFKFTYDPSVFASLIYDPEPYYDAWYRSGVGPQMYTVATVSFGGGPALSLPLLDQILVLGDSTKTYSEAYYNQTLDGTSNNFAFATFYSHTVSGVTTLDPSQTFTHTILPTDGQASYFTLSDGTNLIHADVNLSSVSVVASVPEPGTYGMLLAGLGFLGFAARRRKLKVAAAA